MRNLFISLLIGCALAVPALYATSYSLLPATAYAETDEERENRLRKELAAEEALLQELNTQLSGLKAQSANYARDVSLITTQIKQAQANVKAKGLAIATLSKEISEKEKTVVTLDSRIKKGEESLAQIVRKTNEIDSYSMIEVFLSKKDLAAFFDDVESYNSIQDSMEILFSEIRGNKEKTLAEKEVLRDRQNKELDAKKAIEASERQIALKRTEAEKLLNSSKSKEASYQSLVAEKQKKVNEIKAALFKLRDSAAIPFGKAYEYALEAEKRTGIRPAFLLAILTQESNLGANVGTCNRPGDPPEKLWPAIMKPTRDIEPFKAITASLGINPDGQPLSCPWGNGWGGAMGPAQFIPSTWMLFKDRIAAAAGVTTPNPWDPEHAFIASAIYLTDLGARTQTYSAERHAACRYYSGRMCDAAKPANSFYGDQVMAKSISIQETMINIINED